MKNDILVNYTPINFYKILFGIFTKVFFVFLAGWILFYAISNNTRKEYLKGHILMTCIIFLIVITIALLQTWINSKIYIYQITRNDNTLTFKWQELKLFKEESLPIKDVVVKVKPSGKNTPYLEVKLKTVILKQTYYPGWSKKTMIDFMNKVTELKATQ